METQEELDVIHELDELTNSYLFKVFSDTPDELIWLGKNHMPLPKNTFISYKAGLA